MEANGDTINTLYHLINVGFIFLILLGIVLCVISTNKKENQISSLINTCVIIATSSIAFILVGQNIYNSDGIITFIKRCIFFTNSESTSIYTLVDLALCVLASTWIFTSLTSLTSRITIKQRIILSGLFSALLFPFFIHILTNKIDFYYYQVAFFIICSATFLSLLSHTKKQAQTDANIIHVPKLFIIGASIICLCWLGLAAELAFLLNSEFNLAPTLICVITAILSLVAYRIVLNHHINNHFFLLSIIVTLIAFGSPIHSGYLAAIITGLIIPPLSLTLFISFRPFSQISHLASIILLGTTFGILSIIVKQPLHFFSIILDSGIIFILTYLITSLAMMIIMINKKENDETSSIPPDSTFMKNNNFEPNIITQVKKSVAGILDKHKPKDNFLKLKSKQKLPIKRKVLKGSRSKRKKIRRSKENKNA